jgi:hypothetical protein
MNMAQPPTPPNAPATPRPLMGASIPSDANSYIDDLADTYTMEQLKQKNRIAPSTYNVLAMEKLQGEINATARELALAQAAKQQEDGITGTIAERKPAELRNSVDELNRILGAGAAPMQQPQGQPQMAAQGGIIGYSNGGMNDQPKVDAGSFVAEYGQEALDLIDEYPEAANMLGLGLSVDTARGVMAAQPIIIGSVLKDPRKVVQALGQLKNIKLKDVQDFGTKTLDRLRTLAAPKKGDKGKGTTREDRGSKEKFDAERARLEAERRASGPQTVKDFPDTARPRVSGTLGPPSSGPSQTVLKGGERVPRGQELAPRTTQQPDAAKSGIMSRMKDSVANMSTKKKLGVAAGAGALGYGLDALYDKLTEEERPAKKQVEDVVDAKIDTDGSPPGSSFEVLEKILDEDQDFLTRGQQLSPKAEDRLGPMLEQYKKDAGINLSQVGAEASRDYLDRLGRDEKLEKVNEIFANYKESFEKLYSDEKLSRQRRMAAFSNATGDSVGQVLANMQKGFLATEKAQDAIIQAHLLKVAGHELKALEIDIQMFDKGEERAMAVQKIAAADRLEARRMLGEATREEKADYIKYANYLRDQNDTRINNWLRMVEQFAADFRATDERDLAEVSAAREFQASMLTLRQNGIRSYLNANSEYKELMETLQTAMLEGKTLFPAEQERLDRLYEFARMAVDLEIDAELRVKEQMAEETIAKYDQNRGLSATERALSALSEATNQT